MVRRRINIACLQGISGQEKDLKKFKIHYIDCGLNEKKNIEFRTE